MDEHDGSAAIRLVSCDACGAFVAPRALFFVDAPPSAEESVAHMQVCRACYLRAELAAGNDYRGGWTVAWLLKRAVDARLARLARTAA